MFRLAIILHIFIGSTLAGSAIVAALVAGFDSATALIVAALLGFIVAIPVAAIIAKKLIS